MKKILAVLFACCVFTVFTGCGDGGINIMSGGGKINVRIERSIEILSDPSLTFSADEVSLNYEERKVEIKGISSITGNQFFIYKADTSWVVSRLEVKDSKIIILIPKDANYHIYIGEQYHLLPKIVEAKK